MAPREAFAALKSRLSASAASPQLPPDAVIPTAIPELDRALGGGFPRGTLVTLEGNAGRWSVAARLAAQVTRRALTAIVDDGKLYPPSLAHAGARLDRVLIVPARTPLGTARAVDILLRTRACRFSRVCPLAQEERAPEPSCPIGVNLRAAARPWRRERPARRAARGRGTGTSTTRHGARRASGRPATR